MPFLLLLQPFFSPFVSVLIFEDIMKSNTKEAFCEILFQE
jgi:hypothetical protein